MTNHIETDLAPVSEHLLASAYHDLVNAERDIMERIAVMPADEVPGALWTLTGLDGVVGRIRATLEARASADRLREWTSPEGEVYEFDGTHRRVVRDPDGLRAALEALGTLTAGDMLATFRPKTEVLLTRINELAERDEEVRAIRDDFATWQNGPPHLRKKEERQR